MSSPDPEPLPFERTHRRNQRIFAGIAAVVVLVPGGWIAWDTLEAKAEKDAARLTAAQKVALTALLDARAETAKQDVANWNAAARRDVLDGLVAGDAGCALELTPPPQMSAAAYVRFATHDVAFGDWSMCVLRDAGVCDVAVVPNPNADRLRAKLADDDAYRWDFDDVVKNTARAAPRLVVVPVLETPPIITAAVVGKVSFTPGTLAGRMFAFDPAARGFVCAGDVLVRNSKTVDIEYPHFDETPEEQRKMAEAETRAALERDLEMHLRYAAQKSLRALAP